MTILFFLVNISHIKTEKSELLSTLGDPVPGIDISLEQIPGGKIVTTVTDMQGNYSFNNISEGKYILHFGKMKYSSDGSGEKNLQAHELTHVVQQSSSSQIKDKTVSKQKPDITNEKSRVALDKSTPQQKLNNNSGNIVIYAKNYNSSRSNISHIYSKGGVTIPLISTVLADPQINLLKENINIEIEISKSIIILKGNLTK
jgi:hypothetical protein